MCKVSGCTNVVRARGLCQRHYTQVRLAGKRCEAPGCEAPQYNRELCGRHYAIDLAERRASQALSSCECGCGSSTRRATQTNAGRGTVIGKPRRFLPGHNARVAPLGPEYREVDLGFATPCWIWQKGKSNGYGRVRVEGIHQYAHRVYYERFVAPIPDGWVVHHRCWNRACVNPDHLQVATLTAKNQGCVHGPSSTWVRDRWVPRKRGRYVKLQADELPYMIEANGWKTPCWLWLRPLQKGGYGRIRVGGKDLSAHRYFFEASNGPIPPGLVLDHLCNEASCVNPSHLEAVTQKENLHRKIARQRAHHRDRLVI